MNTWVGSDTSITLLAGVEHGGKKPSAAESWPNLSTVRIFLCWELSSVIDEAVWGAIVDAYIVYVRSPLTILS
jgi:hypothetical protein